MTIILAFGLHFNQKTLNTDHVLGSRAIAVTWNLSCAITLVHTMILPTYS